MVQYEVNISDTGINIIYYGKLFQSNSNNVNMVYDFGKIQVILLEQKK